MKTSLSVHSFLHWLYMATTTRQFLFKYPFLGSTRSMDGLHGLLFPLQSNEIPEHGQIPPDFSIWPSIHSAVSSNFIFRAFARTLMSEIKRRHPYSWFERLNWCRFRAYSR